MDVMIADAAADAAVATEGAADAASAGAADGGIMETLQGWFTDYLPPVIGVLVFVVVSLVVSSWLGRLVSRGLERAKVEKTLSRFLGQVVRWTVLIIALVSCLGVFGIQMTSFAVMLGAAGLAVGLAFQGSLSNLAAGVMLLIFRPFKVDDLVVVNGELGKVKRIELFNTMMDTPDNRRIIMPNGNIFGATIENLTHNPTRRVDVAVGVEYSANVDQTREVLTAAAGAVPGRLDDPPPQVILLGLGDSSVDWQVRVWANTDDYWAVWDAATKTVKVALDEAGIGIPFPQVDVHMPAPSA